MNSDEDLSVVEFLYLDSLDFKLTRCSFDAFFYVSIFCGYTLFKLIFESYFRFIWCFSQMETLKILSENMNPLV